MREGGEGEGISGLWRTDEEGKGGVTYAPTDARNISTYFAGHDGWPAGINGEWKGTKGLN